MNSKLILIPWTMRGFQTSNIILGSYAYYLFIPLRDSLSNQRPPCGFSSREKDSPSTRSAQAKPFQIPLRQEEAHSHFRGFNPVTREALCPESGHYCIVPLQP